MTLLYHIIQKIVYFLRIFIVFFRILPSGRSTTLFLQNKNGITVVWLTWSLTPHSPLPEFFRGLTSKLRHDHCRLADQLTWIPLPVTGLDLQPQTQTTAIPSRIQLNIFTLSCSKGQKHNICRFCLKKLPVTLRCSASCCIKVIYQKYPAAF